MLGAPGADSKESCSQSAQRGHLLCRKSRGLCWKPAFNLGFLFSAPGDAQTGLSFKLFHTSFSKLSSQSRCWGWGGVMKQGKQTLPFPGDPRSRALLTQMVLKLRTSGHQQPTQFSIKLAQLCHLIKMQPKVLSSTSHIQGSPASLLLSLMPDR